MSFDSSQMNFNPSWMQPAPQKCERPNGISFSADDESAQEIMDPVFSNYRYGREDILALTIKEVKPPDGLNRCLFFVDKAQMPIILESLNETEVRLQQNINSSKALSALSRQDRQIVNGNDCSGIVNSKWIVAGNRNFHSNNKPVSNRWSTLGSASGNGSDSTSNFRNVRSTGAQSFSRTTGPGHRPNDPRSSNRFRISSTSNDLTNNESLNNLSENQSPSTSTTNASVGAWSKVGTSKSLKYGENVRSLLTNSEKAAHTKETDDAGVQNLAAVQSCQTSVTEKNEIPENFSFIDSCQPASPIKTPLAERVKWLYLDPTGVQRGPYESKQMQTWFANGYFDSTLRICRVGDKNFYTLGKLFHSNGAVTPFVSKSPELNADVVDKSKSLGNNKNSPDVVNTPRQQLSPNVWSNISGESTTPANINSANNVAQFLPKTNNLAKASFSSQQDLDFQKILLDKERLIEEEQKKLREKEELLQKEELDRLEKERLIQEKEIALQQKQDELQRIAREKEEELERKQQQVAEFEKQRREELEKLEERLLNEHLLQLKQKEEERLRLEAEAYCKLRMLEAEERRKFEAHRLLLERKREEEDANIRAAYEEACRLQEQAVALKAEKVQHFLDQFEKVQLEAELKQKQQEEKTTAEKLRKEEEQRQQEIMRRKHEEELSKVAIEAILNESPPIIKAKASAAPWVTVGTKTSGKKEKHLIVNLEESRGKTLLEIQQEEEEALREKLKQQQELLETHRKNAKPENVSTAWAKPSNAKNTWGTPAFMLSVPDAPSNPASSRSWNSLPVTQTAPIPKAANKDQSNQKKSPKKQQKIVVKELSENQPDPFTMWIIKRVRELNSSVDAEVFASFIEGVDSPNEAEDYIIGYLGESKVVKDFHRDFLNKRIELRPRVQPTPKDDLSGPAAAANDVYSSSVSTGAVYSNEIGSSNNAGKKKKKGKQQKVLDPAILGFKAAGDPNRINAGEIDTAPPAPTNRKR